MERRPVGAERRCHRFAVIFNLGVMPVETGIFQVSRDSRVRGNDGSWLAGLVRPVGPRGALLAMNGAVSASG